MNPQEAVAFMALVAGFFFITRPIVAAFSRRISRDPAPAVPDGVVDDLRAELDDARTRLAALEERVDFAERMLAKQREPERLGPPGRS
ncbi:MAG TPA: hypothetical protein VMC86_13435 [Gemmatimonadales bacterium]|nr:hypothetical protein [Gemmatimonadales bacterium]